MVDRQRKVAAAAILTAMTIPPENVLARKDDFLVGNSDVDGEPDDTRERHRHRNRPKQLAGMSLNELGLAKEKKDDRFLNIADTHWFIVLIEHQNLAVQPTMNAFRSKF